MRSAPVTSRRGAPLAMIGLVLAGWIGARTAVWESPLPASAIGFPPGLHRAAAGSPLPPVAGADPQRMDSARPAAAIAIWPSVVRSGARGAGRSTLAILGSASSSRLDPQLDAGHQLPWREALTGEAPAQADASSGFVADAGSFAGGRLPTAPVVPGLGGAARGADRWSLDLWAFVRQGSSAAPISQGRVPIYGASQAGATLQFRLDPSAGRDPRAYARVYRALVPGGESELALGGSIRPLPDVPVRLFGEARLTDNSAGHEVRPAAFAVTELPVVALPFATRLEAYAQGGWVGGEQPTAFADGQVSLTREAASFGTAPASAARVSVGAGTWAGAQEGAHRIDVGPTVRLDLSFADVPARVSIDWRERVAGNAGPDSGVAATLSTRF